MPRAARSRQGPLLQLHLTPVATAAAANAAGLQQPQQQWTVAARQHRHVPILQTFPSSAQPAVLQLAARSSRPLPAGLWPPLGHCWLRQSCCWTSGASRGGVQGQQTQLANGTAVGLHLPWQQQWCSRRRPQPKPFTPQTHALPFQPAPAIRSSCNNRRQLNKMQGDWQSVCGRRPPNDSAGPWRNG